MFAASIAIAFSHLYQSIMTVVSGKLTNCYSPKDWVLSFIFRSANLTLKVAGLNPVECSSPRLVNVDVSETITGLSYDIFDELEG
jgi:hypothetical protein